MTIDRTKFRINTRVRAYQAVFEIVGEVSVDIEADSLDEATRQAKDLLDDEEFGLELEEVTSRMIYRVRKKDPMFLVTRNGRPMQVSVLQEGDLPRDPDERGF